MATSAARSGAEGDGLERAWAPGPISRDDQPWPCCPPVRTESFSHTSGYTAGQACHHGRAKEAYELDAPDHSQRTELPSSRRPQQRPRSRDAVAAPRKPRTSKPPRRCQAARSSRPIPRPTGCCGLRATTARGERRPHRQRRRASTSGGADEEGRC
jgi:hypothetical protein